MSSGSGPHRVDNKEGRCVTLHKNSFTSTCSLFHRVRVDLHVSKSYSMMLV
jgi:hypothetical protein